MDKFAKQQVQNLRSRLIAMLDGRVNDESMTEDEMNQELVQLINISSIALNVPERLQFGSPEEIARQL